MQLTKGGWMRVEARSSASVIVIGGEVVRPSQLIASVRRTCDRERGSRMILMALLIAASVGQAADQLSLSKQLDASLAQLIPGRNLLDVKAKLGDGVVELEPSTEPAGRHVYLIVTVRHAGRSAWQAVTCDFDAGGRLTRCLNQGHRHLEQTVAEADWDRITKGAALPTIYRTIGPPADPILGVPPGYETALEYMVKLTKPTPHWSTCAGRILIKKAVVAAKELMCE
jgi:hypothetical protein